MAIDSVDTTSWMIDNTLDSSPWVKIRFDDYYVVKGVAVRHPHSESTMDMFKNIIIKVSDVSSFNTELSKSDLASKFVLENDEASNFAKIVVVDGYGNTFHNNGFSEILFFGCKSGNVLVNIAMCCGYSNMIK